MFKTLSVVISLSLQSDLNPLSPMRNFKTQTDLKACMFKTQTDQFISSQTDHPTTTFAYKFPPNTTMKLSEALDNNHIVSSRSQSSLHSLLLSRHCNIYLFICFLVVYFMEALLG